VIQNNYDKNFFGLRYFNVFGPNEYHKGSMRSVVHKVFLQIQKNEPVSLFKSYHPNYADGEQKRDFIYVKDCSEILWNILSNKKASGIFNIGTGNARTWKDLVTAIFCAVDKKAYTIDYIDMPDYLKPKYQYHTQADTSQLLKTTAKINFSKLEDAVADYVSQYLIKEQRVL
jgi:ADP-L-glycero-D-manno-heptose 6-epimerase